MLRWHFYSGKDVCLLFCWYVKSYVSPEDHDPHTHSSCFHFKHPVVRWSQLMFVKVLNHWVSNRSPPRQLDSWILHFGELVSSKLAFDLWDSVTPLAQNWWGLLRERVQLPWSTTARYHTFMAPQTNTCTGSKSPPACCRHLDDPITT